MGNTQNSRLYAYIKEHGSVTTLEAFRELGITRLSARIWELRHEGKNIVGTMEAVKDRNGETARVMRYRIGDQ